MINNLFKYVNIKIAQEVYPPKTLRTNSERVRELSSMKLAYILQ